MQVGSFGFISPETTQNSKRHQNCIFLFNASQSACTEQCVKSLSLQSRHSTSKMVEVSSVHTAQLSFRGAAGDFQLCGLDLHTACPQGDWSTWGWLILLFSASISGLLCTLYKTLCWGKQEDNGSWMVLMDIQMKELVATADNSECKRKRGWNRLLKKALLVVRILPPHRSFNVNRGTRKHWTDSALLLLCHRTWTS